jgi:hypothetical protein
MKNYKIIVFLMSLCFLCFKYNYAQDSSFTNVPLNDLSAFKEPVKNWQIASSVSSDIQKPMDMKASNGTGILLSTSNNSTIITSQTFDDVELDFDFMLSKDADAIVFMQGRYGIKLTDSWTKVAPQFSDMGGIPPFSDSSNKKHFGIAPLVNVSKAPGLWQHIKIKFRSPKFQDGVKVQNSRFDEVYLNGVLIQVQTDIAGPTEAAPFNDETDLGPIILEAIKGGIAFRNIGYRDLPPPSNEIPASSKNRRDAYKTRVINPIIIAPEKQPYLLRSFLNFDNVKRTHVISVGFPNQINYSYDLKQGALLQVWRGKYLDVTNMWESRGEPQLAKPLGSVVPLSAKPALSVQENENSTWPSSIEFDDFHNEGYTLDGDKVPTFLYTLDGVKVKDKISARSDGEGIVREISVTETPANYYCRIASGKTIENLSNGLYAVAGQEYYIEITKKYKPLIRKTKTGQELIVPLGNNESLLNYSIIF